MKKIFLSLILICFTSSMMSPAYAWNWPWSKNKGSALSESLSNSGYTGELPDLEAEFEYLRPNTKSKNVFKIDENANVEDLIPAPREEKMYIDIIKKKDKTSQYIHDVNDVIFALEKLKTSIIQGATTQVFNSQVSYFIDLAYYIQREYSNKPEANYISYGKIMSLSNHAYSIASLRRESSYYGKYLSFSQEGYVYSPDYINEQLQYLLDAINETLPILKDIE